MSRDLTKYTKVVYSFDYDGLIDPNYLDELIAHIGERLTQYPEAIHELRVGSLRNTRYINVINELTHKNGSCFAFMVNFLHILHKKFPAFKNQIILNRMLIEDIENNEAPGTNFDKGLKQTLREKIEMFRLVPPPRITWHDTLKNSQLYLQLHDAHNLPDPDFDAIFGPDTAPPKTLFEFFDDRLDILKSVHSLFHPEHSNFLPGGETFQVYQVEKGRFSKTNLFNPIFGKGPANPRYKVSAKLLNDPIAVELICYGVTTELKLIPLTNKPHDLIGKVTLSYEWHDIVCEIEKVSDARKKEALYDALLRTAIIRNQTGNVHQLLTFGINFTGLYKGMTPIELAAHYNHWRCVFALSENPSDADDNARYGEALVMAAENREIELAIHLAKRIPTPVNRVTSKTNSGRSIFYFAISSQSHALLDAILENQDRNNPKFIDALSMALTYAYAQKNISAIQKLLPYCLNPLEELVKTTHHHSDDGVFDCVFEYIEEQKIRIPKEMLAKLFQSFIENNNSTLCALITQSEGLSDEEKNALITLKQKHDEVLTRVTTDRPTKKLLQDFLKTTCVTLSELSNTHKKLHQLYSQICAVEGELLSDDAIITLLYLFEECEKEPGDTTEFLYIFLIANTIFSYSAVDRLIRETANVMADDDKRIRIEKIYGHYQIFQRILHGENKIDPAKAMAFIADHLTQYNPDEDAAMLADYLNANLPGPTPIAPLLDALDKQITRPCNTACKNAYRALKTAILIDNPTDHAALVRTINRWKKASNDIISGRTNETVLDESDDIQRVKCPAFSKPPTQKHFLKKFENIFAKPLARQPLSVNNSLLAPCLSQ